MPIFEYKCRKCGKQFEHLVLPTDTKAASCPKCHSKGKSLEQLISMFMTPNDAVLQRQIKMVKKESGNIKYEERQAELRHADD